MATVMQSTMLLSQIITLLTVSKIPKVKCRKAEKRRDTVTPFMVNIDPDGVLRTVKYTADKKNGFQAEVITSGKSNGGGGGGGNGGHGGGDGSHEESGHLESQDDDDSDEYY
ncbi:hypothetical protein HA402_002908 [Bradysia odoriphaga]|nr:hypothetical protein HA402_002908 [Bradysia odoriphaga]